MEQAKFKEEWPNKVQMLRKKVPHSLIEVWFFDEHRVGLKPIFRQVWAKVGERPLAMGQHRYEWLSVYGFVQPKTGKTHCYLIPRVNTQWLNLVDETFARDVGVSPDKQVF